MTSCFFFNDTATTEIYTLSLHDALPISNDTLAPLRSYLRGAPKDDRRIPRMGQPFRSRRTGPSGSEGRWSLLPEACGDRKSTRLNSSHSQISYAVFCLKKKKHLVEVELY